MKNTFKNKFSHSTSSSRFYQVSAQKKDDNIGTEVVNVVKPYSPTISDAFKVKRNTFF
ncbi:MAG: hypothetical protein U0T80_08635 [Flavobacteriaceae bacterium]